VTGVDDGRDTRETAQLAARDSYGRLVAYLARRWRDVAAAEDALGDAFVAALESWPRAGVPDKPEAWLLAVARRRLVDVARHASVEGRAVHNLGPELDQVELDPVFPDERLKLLFVCAHPAIDERARTPLMLQTVLGLDAARIASAFLVAPATMAQRLVRAKARIRDARIGFEVPEPTELSERLGAVLEAIYAGYGTGWDDVTGADGRGHALAGEAIWLGRLVTRLLPHEPEAHGLLALMLHCEARRTARRDANGAYVPLDRQDIRLWSRPMIEEAEATLATAARPGQPGRFQLEAAIQSVHAARAVTGRTDWPAIALLYAGLLACAPTIGARVGHAAALAEAESAQAGMDALVAIPAGAVATYQPYWALRAHLLGRLGRRDEAREAYDRAIGLSDNAAVREFLAGQARVVGGGSS
jgi:predicted RNA polymerase sigma factor